MERGNYVRKKWVVVVLYCCTASGPLPMSHPDAFQHRGQYQPCTVPTTPHPPTQQKTPRSTRPLGVVEAGMGVHWWLLFTRNESKNEPQ